MEKVFRRQHLCQLIVVALLPILTYFGGLTNPFTSETFDWLSWVALPDVSTWYDDYLGYSFRPLQILILYPVYQLSGLNPLPYRLFVLFLHISCSILVFYLGWVVSKRSAVGFVSGIIFSMYPRHHEVVSWLAAFYSPMTLFGLISFVSFVLFLKRKNLKLYGLSLLSFVLALLSHETVVTLLPLMYIGEMLIMLPAGDRGWLKSLVSFRTWKKYIPFAAFVMLDVVIALSTKTSIKLSGANSSYHFTGLGMESIKTLASYVVYLVYPQIRLRTLDVGFVTVAISLVTAAVLLYLLLKGTTLMRLGVLWMIAAIVPFVLVGSFGNQDRYFYLAAVGYALVLGACAVELWKRLERPSILTGRILVVLLLAGYVISSFFIIQRRTYEWRVAGTVSSDIIAQVKSLYPQVPRGSRMYFVNLPSDYHGAHVFGTGIKGAMRLIYNDGSLSALYTGDRQIIQRLTAEDDKGQGVPVPGLYVFLYQGGQIRDRTASYTVLRDDLENVCWYDRYNVLCPEVEK